MSDKENKENENKWKALEHKQAELLKKFAAFTPQQSNIASPPPESLEKGNWCKVISMHSCKVVLQEQELPPFSPGKKG